MLSGQWPKPKWIKNVAAQVGSTHPSSWKVTLYLQFKRSFSFFTQSATFPSKVFWTRFNRKRVGFETSREKIITRRIRTRTKNQTHYYSNSHPNTITDGSELTDTPPIPNHNTNPAAWERFTATLLLTRYLVEEEGPCLSRHTKFYLFKINGIKSISLVCWDILIILNKLYIYIYIYIQPHAYLQHICSRRSYKLNVWTKKQLPYVTRFCRTNHCSF